MMGCSPYAIARLLVERAEHELQTARADVPDRVAVVPDRPPGEFCAQLWAAVISYAPKPARTPSTVKSCAAEWRVQITLGVYRCDPSINPSHPEQAPDPVRLDSAARDQLDDAEALRRAILHADWALLDVDPEQVQVGPMRVVGRSGGAFGVEHDVVVDTELGRFTDAAVPMLPTDPRKDTP
ncbi:hypothetical protein J1765_gp27 [Gordonia phage Gaea]|uniref:Uncharacterized protein n=6 Tax=Kroosvirus TaxID=2948789 RepID=A0A3G3M9D7_9CAUD|nr:hypothetical protein J1765_gp27 [Gordonia phage Gaea]YP_010001992.1 hypothetical protein J1766_gp28 [Gordonia phage Bizzy]AYR02664.1 hypothetical protein SEA_BIZZY_28 [Gordonia phage Bizzy]AYR02835.1 hypothetical protein SEA_GAEA_27 [Gordonia phage Gaea]UAJ15695.1 hypothetical protein SEA_BADDON_27 [Gordonia phage Baddon]